MKNTIARILFVPALVLAVAVAAQGGDAKKDIEKLQGKWTRTYESDGKKITLEMTFEGDKYTFLMFGQTYKGSVKLNPAKDLKQIDLTVSEGAMKDFVGKTSLGIYAIEGDTLKWCANEPGKASRPTSFPKSEGDAKKEGEHLYVIFKKAK